VDSHEPPKQSEPAPSVRTLKIEEWKRRSKSAAEVACVTGSVTG